MKHSGIAFSRIKRLVANTCRPSGPGKNRTCQISLGRLWI